MMKKKLALLIVLLAALLPASAQNDVQKEINRIKSSPNYVYGEATRANREEALDAAFNDMMHEADRWAAEKTHDSDVEMSGDDVREMVQSLETKRGSQTRVLVYVKLSKLASLLREAGYKVKFEEQPEEGGYEAAPAPKPRQAAPKSDDDSLPVSTVADDRETTSVPEVTVISIEGLSDEEILDVYLYSNQKMTPEQEAAVERAAARLAERLNVVIGNGTALDKILAVRSFYDLKSVMVPLKLNGEITKLGKYRTMREPQKSYLIIYDTDARIRAVLGPGTDRQRKNLRTGYNDSIYNYGGCGAIWFQLNE
ncbi:MAG: hypothetical protein IJ559_00690 [Prevotella sp.]|nr:hypothetical protein [Prevotella sp.]